MELERGVSAALGITVDGDGEAVVLVVIATPEHQVGVPMSPEIALSYSREMRKMAREAQNLQDELEDLDPEEIVDRLQAIQQRYSSPNGDGEE
jgi:hypothetical protein